VNANPRFRAGDKSKPVKRVLVTVIPYSTQ
jgi:hypothetical protein